MYGFYNSRYFLNVRNDEIEFWNTKKKSIQLHLVAFTGNQSSAHFLGLVVQVGEKLYFGWCIHVATGDATWTLNKCLHGSES